MQFCGCLCEGMNPCVCVVMCVFAYVGRHTCLSVCEGLRVCVCVCVYEGLRVCVYV